MPEDRARPQLSDHTSDPAGEPDRVADARPLLRSTRDRDRHLADPGHVDHVELTGLDAVSLLPLALLELEPEGRHTGGLRLDRPHDRRMRTERVVLRRHPRRADADDGTGPTAGFVTGGIIRSSRRGWRPLPR